MISEIKNLNLLHCFLLTSTMLGRKAISWMEEELATVTADRNIHCQMESDSSTYYDKKLRLLALKNQSDLTFTSKELKRSSAVIKNFPKVRVFSW